MDSFIVINLKKINSVNLTEKEINDFENFNQNLGRCYYYIWLFKSYEKVFLKLENDTFFNEDLYDILYIYLSEFKHIIDTFPSKYKNDFGKVKIINRKDPLIVFLIILRNYIQHNYLKNLKYKQLMETKEKYYIFPIEDILHSIPKKHKKDLEILYFLSDKENKYINVTPLISESFSVISKYLLDILDDYCINYSFKEMKSIYSKLENIKIDSQDTQLHNSVSLKYEEKVNLDEIDVFEKDMIISEVFQVYLKVSNQIDVQQVSDNIDKRIKKNDFLIENIYLTKDNI